MRSTNRGEAVVGEMKRSKRYTPYGDRDRPGKLYKNIVPAPRRDVDKLSPPMVPMISPSQQHTPKRKRDEENESPEYFDRTGIPIVWGIN